MLTFPLSVVDPYDKAAFLLLGSLLLVFILWELVTGVSFPFIDGETYQRTKESRAYWVSVFIQLAVAVFFFAAMFLTTLASAFHYFEERAR